MQSRNVVGNPQLHKDSAFKKMIFHYLGKKANFRHANRMQKK